MARSSAPIGVILAGGLGLRIGGSKAVVRLRGKPLICYPLEAMRQVLGEVVIIAKADTELPSLPRATVWVEPDAPRHPLLGIMHALSLAEGRPVLTCAIDLPFVTSEVIAQIAATDPGDAPAIVASCGGETQPLLGCYQPESLTLLRRPSLSRDLRLREAIEAIGAGRMEVDPQILFNVNTPDDLLQAAGMLDPPRRQRAAGQRPPER
jgi:molybdenum cofactor guanylyltransferase